jgi:2-oxoglutarate/2-oxoacid ferredoxin oxidoreductase subunit alpha
LAAQKKEFTPKGLRKFMSAPVFSIKSVFSVKIGGEAGQGIKSTGLMLAKFATRAGFNIYNYIEYPSLIRGGHNVMQVNVSTEVVTGPFLKCDFLIALNQDTINKHCSELVDGAGILFDADKKYDLSKLGNNIHVFPVPLSRLAKETGGKELLSNTVALGATVGILGGSISGLKDLITESFKDKGEEISQTNLIAVQAGYDYATTNFKEGLKSVLKSPDLLNSAIPQMIVNGNDACALGAISAGLQFAAIYPMSPLSGILATLAQYQEKYSYVYKQPEDEISAINMAIGASFAGARSMTATSGGGFCLMTEGYGLAGMTETPLVIVEGMRGGPATGLPTWSEQGDLRMVLHAHQGEFPRIILAAGDAGEAFDLTRQAFNLAEIYQTPVVVLIDKNICDDEQNFQMFDPTSYQINRGKTIEGLDSDYHRYKVESGGVSTRAFPGSGNFFIANSDEHDEKGYSTEEIEMRTRQMQKRMEKLQTCARNHMQGPKLYGPKKADLTLVSWGSNKGPILETLKTFPNVNYLHLTWLNPFPTQVVASLLKTSKRLLNVENNYSAQMGGLIREKTGIELPDNLLRYDGRPFFVEELTEKIKSALKGRAL